MLKNSQNLLCILTTTLLLSMLTSTVAAESANYTDQATGMEFILIEGGTFLMGDPTGKDKIASPAHDVTVGTFYLGKYEVTLPQYDKFCKATGRPFLSDEGRGRSKYPAANVTWEDAVAFTEWLSKRSGRIYRLPSEAEWEYAARSGATTIYPWGDNIGTNMANCNACGSQWDGKGAAPVGSFPPNDYGLYDMIGNVYEWTLDTKHDNYIGAPTDGSARLDEGPDGRRINRGGSWLYRPVDAELAGRCWEFPNKSQSDYGFRVLMEE